MYELKATAKHPQVCVFKGRGEKTKKKDINADF